MRYYKLKTFLFASYLLTGLLISQVIWAAPLPDLGDPSLNILPPMEEQILGKKFMQQLRATGLVIDDPIDAQYLNGLGQRLVSAANVTHRSFFFFFMNDPAVNSFAGPGGYIAVNSGLMLETQNESELAAVMAHEIAHVTQGHLARKLADQSQLKFSQLAGVLAAVALGRAAGGEAAESALAVTVAGGQQTMLNYSREYEEEADRVGIATLEKAHFDPNSMVTFFERLSRQEQYNLQAPALLSDHPLTPERIADAENRAAQLPTIKAVSSTDYFLIKERIRVQTAEDTHALLNYYQKKIASHQYQNLSAMQYGYALAKLANVDYQGAYADFAALAQQDPNQLLYQLGMAHVLAAENKLDAALALLKTASATYPDNYAVMVQYAYTLTKAQQAKAAVQLIDNYHLNYPTFPVPYALLAESQAKAGELALAYQSRAHYLVEMGAPQAALAQLKIALKLPSNDADTVARIKAQILEIQAQMKE